MVEIKSTPNKLVTQINGFTFSAFKKISYIVFLQNTLQYKNMKL